ncbi:MAG: cell division protein FtsQ [Marinilabiliaceae bacterium]|nr:cell division protein FtsQ [Marinilabiliaceae bacterium]
MNRFWKIVLWILVGLYIPIILSFVSVSRNRTICNSVKVSINDSVRLKFVSENEIQKLVQHKFKTLLGSSINELNIESIEDVVRSYPAVEDCQIYPSVEGTLCVVVDQRKPLVRIFERGSSYLLDLKGYKIPLRGSYKDHLPIANGYLDRLNNKSDLIVITGYINNDDFWSAQIEQLYVDSKGEFVLIPRVGQHIIIFGDISDMEKKFRNLMALYKSGLHPLEWNQYKTINLKYKGQVICSKK